MMRTSLSKTTALAIILALGCINTWAGNYPVAATQLVNQSVTPTITVTEVTAPVFSTTVGNPENQTIDVSGTNLTAKMTLTISGANADQFSLSQSTVTQTNGTAPITVVTVTYTPTATGTHTAMLTLSSPGAIDTTSLLSGTSLNYDGINTINQELNISTQNGNILFSANAGEVIYISNTLGQTLIHKVAVEGENSISVQAHGILLVKVGSRVAKVIL
jgi:hypothetical protein